MNLIFNISGFNFNFWNPKLLLMFALCLLLFSSSCSIPNLEKPECTEARQTVKEFYSYHFGNDMKPLKENLQPRGKFLTDQLNQQLLSQIGGATDYFTQTDDYPKTFRVGSCEVVDSEKTIFGVLLFWKTDTRSEQREIKVETVKRQDKWLINRVESK